MKPVLCHLSFLVISSDLLKTCSPVLLSTLLKTDKNDQRPPNKMLGKRMFMVKIETAWGSA